MEKRSSAALPVISGILLIAVVALLVWVVLAQPQADGPEGFGLGGNSTGAATEEVFEDLFTLYAQTGGANIRVTASDDGRVYVRYPDSLTVNLTHDAVSAHLDISVQDAPFGIFSWGRSESNTIEIAMPQLNAVVLAASGGNIDIAQAQTSTLYVSTKSGNIDAQRLEVTGYISLDAQSGDVTCVNFYAASIAANAASGNIRLEQAYAGEISMNTSSGNQSLRAEMGALAYCYTNSGNVDLDCREPLEGWARTTSGNVTIRMPYDPQRVTFSTNSGDAQIENSVIRESIDDVYDDQYVYEAEPGGPTLEVYTESGNLILR